MDPDEVYAHQLQAEFDIISRKISLQESEDKLLAMKLSETENNLALGLTTSLDDSSIADGTLNSSSKCSPYTDESKEDSDDDPFSHAFDSDPIKNDRYAALRAVSANDNLSSLFHCSNIASTSQAGKVNDIGGGGLGSRYYNPFDVHSESVSLSINHVTTPTGHYAFPNRSPTISASSGAAFAKSQGVFHKQVQQHRQQQQSINLMRNLSKSNPFLSFPTRQSVTSASQQGIVGERDSVAFDYPVVSQKDNGVFATSAFDDDMRNPFVATEINHVPIAGDLLAPPKAHPRRERRKKNSSDSPNKEDVRNVNWSLDQGDETGSSTVATDNTLFRRSRTFSSPDLIRTGLEAIAYKSPSPITDDISGSIGSENKSNVSSKDSGQPNHRLLPPPRPPKLIAERRRVSDRSSNNHLPKPSQDISNPSVLEAVLPDSLPLSIDVATEPVITRSNSSVLSSISCKDNDDVSPLPLLPPQPPLLKRRVSDFTPNSTQASQQFANSRGTFSTSNRNLMHFHDGKEPLNNVHNDRFNVFRELDDARRKVDSDANDVSLSLCDVSESATEVVSSPKIESPPKDMRDSILLDSPGCDDIDGNDIKASTYKENMLEQRGRAAQELLETERTYVDGLLTIQQVFQQPMTESGLVKPRDIKIMFPGYVRMIFEFHSVLLSRLEHRMKVWTPDQLLGDIFSSPFMDFLKIYMSYVNSYSESCLVLERYRQKSAHFRQFLQVRELACHGLSLVSFWLTPVQRLPRYLLLFQELLKYTPADHPDTLYLGHALQKIRDITEYVNHAQGLLQGSGKLIKMASHIKGIPKNFVLPHRLLLKESDGVHIRVFGRCVKGRVFLTNDVLLLTRRRMTSLHSGNSEETGGEFDHLKDLKVVDVFVLLDITVKSCKSPLGDKNPGLMICGLNHARILMFDSQSVHSSWELAIEEARNEELERVHTFRSGKNILNI